MECASRQIHISCSFPSKLGQPPLERLNWSGGKPLGLMPSRIGKAKLHDEDSRRNASANRSRQHEIA